MLELIHYHTLRPLTNQKRLRLRLLCKLLHQKRLPAVLYKSLQHSGFDREESANVFCWLLPGR